MLTLVPCAEIGSWEAASASVEIFPLWRSTFRSFSRRTDRSVDRRRRRRGERSLAGVGDRRSDSSRAGRRTYVDRGRRNTRL